ncbi:MAG: HPr(Ser) kinase/phosphatase [Candidatus Neomarinimicrobiota bacterium]|jgi:HPr kinase/phosphorylase|nr:HPr(Ser) kinase/phosphatase [Candidatus Neomarinimicrobiota bacterium]MDX9781133.1 HPr(Ser) kinase/phosphatase [bacterium]
MKKLSVHELIAETRSKLQLKQINPEAGDDGSVTSSVVNIPGLELTGFWTDFPRHKLQVFSKKEMQYIATLSPAAMENLFRKMFAFKIPAAIFVETPEIQPIIIELANEAGVPLLQTDINIMQFLQDMGNYLYKRFAPTTIIHGGLVDVHGVGILLTGKSGIGKSEIALDIVERGHRLVADDVVDIRRTARNVLIGKPEELLQDTIEVRGLGIVNIRKIFGARAVRVQKRVEMMIELLRWEPDVHYERFGLTEDHISILGVSIPHIRLPINPGKNISVIVETIAMTYLLKLYGEDPAKEMQEKLLKELKEKSVNLNGDTIEEDPE